MSVSEQLLTLCHELPKEVTLIAVSKTKPDALIMEAYEAGQRDFGENYVQELCDKHLRLPNDIRWHFIGHLQSNKVKYIAPFVHLIHGVDSIKLLQEIHKQGLKNQRVIPCLLQCYIAREESKFGLSEDEILAFLQSDVLQTLSNVRIEGLMGMATNTDNTQVVRQEFASLKNTFDKIQVQFPKSNQLNMHIISMGMSGDYKMAIEEGSTMIRVGSSIFGARDYSKS